jgi:hypothetical protein
MATAPLPVPKQELAMRTKAETPLLRRGLMLHDWSSSRWGTLRTDTEAASDSEVVRRALLVYEKLVDGALAGKVFLIRDQHGEDYQLASVTAPSSSQEVCDSRGERRNLILQERSAARLDELRSRTGASSDSEVVRQALTIYETLVNKTIEGCEFIIRDPRKKTECQFEILASPTKGVSTRPLFILDRLRALTHTTSEP